MSFLFDDDEPLVQSQEVEFVCDNCGSTNCYEDPVTGNNVCQDCFTQSQLFSQEHETLDHDEIMNMAARSRGGQLVFSQIERNRRRQHRRRELTRQPLSELDQSMPLPSLKSCLAGMQYVLKLSCRRLAELVGMREEVHCITETVRDLWIAYLRAYSDGAEHYGRHFPEVRFSLYDSFLSRSLHSDVLKTAAYKVANEAQQGNSDKDSKTAQKKESRGGCDAGDREMVSDNDESGRYAKRQKSYSDTDLPNVATSNNVGNEIWPSHEDYDPSSQAWNAAHGKSQKFHADDEGGFPESLSDLGASISNLYRSGGTFDDSDDKVLSIPSETQFPPIEGEYGYDMMASPVIDRKSSHLKKAKYNAQQSSSSNRQSPPTEPRPHEEDATQTVPDTVNEGSAAPIKSLGKQKKRGPAKLNNNIIKQIIKANLRAGKELGYKEAALLIRPSMEVVAAMLWLVVSKSGISSYRISQWIADGELPLQSMHSLMPHKLRRKLIPVAPFFRMPYPLLPRIIEKAARVLAVACRMKRGDFNMERAVHAKYPNMTQDIDFRFCAENCLPLLIARTVADMGLGQDILDRTLSLISIRALPTVLGGPDAESLVGICPERITCTEDVLAVIAIASQMDPSWRCWAFAYGKPSPIAYNSDQLLRMSLSSAAEYLGRIDDLTQYDILHRNCVDDLHMADRRSPVQKDDTDGDATNDWAGNHFIFAGARLKRSEVKRCKVKLRRWKDPHNEILEEPRLTLLLDFLAQSCRCETSTIRTKMKFFLEERKGDHM